MFKPVAFSLSALIAVVVSFFSVAIPLSASANDADRIGQLERDIQEIKRRLSSLEAPSVNTNVRQTPPVAGEGWKSLSNWRSLNNGMGYEEVRNLLGEPQRVNGGDIALWYYPNSGEVTFFRGKLDRWAEPRSR